MRRGRILAAAAATVAVLLATATGAVAGSPQSLFSHNAVQQGYGGVGSSGTQGSKSSKPANQVAGAQKTVQRSAGAVAPATHAAGTLPFTGLQLTIFVLIGIALIGGGLLVRRVGGRRGQG